MDITELLQEFQLKPIQKNNNWSKCLIELGNQYSYDTIFTLNPVILIKDDILLSFDLMKHFSIKHNNFFAIKDGEKKFFKITQEIVRNTPVGLVSSYKDEEKLYVENFYLSVFIVKEIPEDESHPNLKYIYEHFDYTMEKAIPEIFFQIENKKTRPTNEEIAKLIDWLL